MAGAEGIEPSLAVLETDVIPFHYAPLINHQNPAKRGDDYLFTSLCCMWALHDLQNFFKSTLLSNFFDL